MRADLYLFDNGYAPSRQRARLMIEEGTVTIDGARITKPAQQIADGAHQVQVEDPLLYVSRGGLKLEAALDAFRLDVTNLRALDIGASTGGFTDCLLQRGASRVYAVDAGDGQLSKKLMEDARVLSVEHLNARELSLAHIENEPVDIIVMDVSFISSTYIIPRFPTLLRPEGIAVSLIKPQFEVGKEKLGKGGIVKDPAAHIYAIERVCSCAESVGMSPIALITSPITGGDGNREFLVCFTMCSNPPCKINASDIRHVVAVSGTKGVL